MKKIISLLKQYFSFVISFVFTKGAVYFVPLLLADYLTTSEFGVLEYSLAGLGFIVNGLIGFGIPGGYPYFVLKQKKLSIINGFSLHPLWLLSLFVINQISFFYFGLKQELYLAFNISYIIANQSFYSTQLKSHENPIKAIFLDSGIYLVLALHIILYKIGVCELSINKISLIIALYACLYLIVAVYKFYRVQKDKIFFNYKKILSYSFNVMMSTFFIFLITSSGRILIEHFFSFKEVGVYGFYFRLSAVVVMIYQMISIVFFKKIYTLNPKILDKYYSFFFIALFVISISVFLISPLILNHFSVFFKNTYMLNKHVYFLLSSQMIMWIATALNSSIINRENLIKKNNIYFFLLIIISMGVFYLIKNVLVLDVLVLIHYSVIFVACLIQYICLRTKNIYFKRSIIVLTSCYLLTVFAYFFVI